MVLTTQAPWLPITAEAEARSVQIVNPLKCTTSAERNRTRSAKEAGGR